MLSKKIGDELDCVVSGLTNFGVFVQSRRFGIEGLIQMPDLGPDQWKYDMKSQCIIGQHTGLSVRLGQAMKVRIVSVNIPARQLNVAPTEPLTGKIRQKEGRRTRKFRRKSKNN
jgi:ribonuclease R